MQVGSRMLPCVMIFPPQLWLSVTWSVTLPGSCQSVLCASHMCVSAACQQILMSVQQDLLYLLQYAQPAALQLKQPISLTCGIWALNTCECLCEARGSTPQCISNGGIASSRHLSFHTCSPTPGPSRPPPPAPSTHYLTGLSAGIWHAFVTACMSGLCSPCHV